MEYLAQITITPVFPIWLILLLLVLGLAAVLLQYGFIRKTAGAWERPLRSPCFASLSFFLLISFALNPSLIEKKEHQDAVSLAILIDASQSMNQAGPGGKVSRLDEARSTFTSRSRVPC